MQNWLFLGVQPEPGNREGRAWPVDQTQYLHIEIPCRLQLVGDDGEVVHAQDHIQALDWHYMNELSFVVYIKAYDSIFGILIYLWNLLAMTYGLAMGFVLQLCCRTF